MLGALIGHKYDLMVHYDPNIRRAAQPPSPTCPKCGSHRTEVVDRTDDGRSITVRCNVCGARATVLIDRRATDADNVTDEIEAIRTVGRALAQLPDAASRVRVMRWASERFQIDLTVVAASAAAQARATVADRPADIEDPTLSTEGLDDLFPMGTGYDDHAVGYAEPMMAEARPTVNRHAMPSIVAEPVMVYTEPAPAKAQPLMLNAAPLFVDAELVDETLQVEETPQAEQAPRIESMVRSLVSDFQRLALDLDTVFATPVSTR